jgi:hypothetical protein
VFPLRITNVPPSPVAIVRAFGFGIARWNGLALPVELGAAGLPGCQLWIEPGATTFPTTAGSTLSHPIVIPGHAGLTGIALAAQVFVLDATSPNGLGAASNAAVLRLY